MSIPTAFAHVNEQAGVGTEFEYDTKPENMHVLYYIARNQLYSDEVLAVLREYSCNGMDIHIKMGQPNRPIRVTFPTQLDSFLKIRDFGSGLDERGIQGYVSFGESDKRSDPNQTGQLGIGCKSAFTYGDSFIVNSYLNGKLYVWNAYIDPSNKGKIALMAESDTTEPDGIEVVIPIRANDVDKTHEKAMWLFSFWPVVPEFINATDADVSSFKHMREAVPVFQGKGWKFYGTGQSYAVMGNIPYPINADVFTDTEISPETKELLSGGIIIQFKMNELDFAASREQLKYTPKTKKTIVVKLTDITTDLFAQFSASFTGCKTLWEAKLLYRKVFDFSSKLYHLRNLFRASLTFNGFKINTEAFPVGLVGGNDTDVVCWRYSKQYNGKIRRNQVYNIPADENVVVVLNDTSIMNGIMNRVVPLIEGPQKATYVYILSFINTFTRDAYLKEVGLDCPLPSLTSLPKKPLSTYYPNNFVTNDSRSNKHFSREFIFNFDHQVSRYRGMRSEFWEVTNVNLDKDKGVYVILDKFNYASNDGIWAHPSDLKRFLNLVKTAGIDVPDIIYGFKRDSATRAGRNPKMQTLRDWFKVAAKTYLDTHPEVAQKFINYSYIQNEVKNMQSDLLPLMQLVSKWDIDSLHRLRAFHDKLKVLCQYNEEQMRSLSNIIHQIGYEINLSPTYDLRLEFNVLYERYPMLFKLVSLIGLDYFHEEEWKKHLNEYVIMVDLLVPSGRNV